MRPSARPKAARPSAASLPRPAARKAAAVGAGVEASEAVAEGTAVRGSRTAPAPPARASTGAIPTRSARIVRTPPIRVAPPDRPRPGRGAGAARVADAAAACVTSRRPQPPSTRPRRPDVHASPARRLCPRESSAPEDGTRSSRARRGVRQASSAATEQRSMATQIAPGPRGYWHRMSPSAIRGTPRGHPITQSAKPLTQRRSSFRPRFSSAI